MKSSTAKNCTKNEHCVKMRSPSRLPRAVEQNAAGMARPKKHSAQESQ